jgi:hypothetical protein
VGGKGGQEFKVLYGDMTASGDAKAKASAAKPGSASEAAEATVPAGATTNVPKLAWKVDPAKVVKGAYVVATIEGIAWTVKKVESDAGHGAAIHIEITHGPAQMLGKPALLYPQEIKQVSQHGPHTVQPGDTVSYGTPAAPGEGTVVETSKSGVVLHDGTGLFYPEITSHQKAAVAEPGSKGRRVVRPSRERKPPSTRHRMRGPWSTRARPTRKPTRRPPPR